MHVVAVLALDTVIAFDLATATDVFGWLRLADGTGPYEVRVCGLGPVDAGAFTLEPRFGLDALTAADTVIVPGVRDVRRPPPAVLDALVAAAARGARVASICSGAFVLAEAGLLDGLRATTHWRATDELARRFPAVRVDPDVLYVDNGQVLTSAGAAAGLDLCLHLVRRDHGAAVAAMAARDAVMPLERDGGQSQFITHPPPTPDGGSLEPLLRWVDQHLADPLPLGTLARRAAMSERTLSRRFHEQTGTTPAQWVLTARVRRAQALLETTALNVEQIAGEVGFRSSAVLRERFGAVVGTSPVAYRRAFQARG
jgi:transcriptional regulator GlxA family with amidase domain